ncbi:pyridoxal phosphate-dependent decarboxylase family protein [Nocardioides sp. Root151]|uniref:pyridoxal phosphate-dependent decarboxylase family protein n=1 Tax=Nocardioides sp. Root151 TaxID=1736475 RepID=UPI0007036F82|nr:aspartate aminotransferase family protein [Nocardioides sp. Root151]KQZ76067.1 hypothetical protein ASD66_07225 [Nocardioides sp. Root151]
MSHPSAHHLFHPANADAWATTVLSGVAHLGRQLAEVDGPSNGTAPELAAKLVADVDLDTPLNDTTAALEEMSRLYLDDAVWFHEPGYAAHLNCPVVIPALLAELYVSSVNSSLDTYDQSVGGTFIERHLIDWTAARIGFPETTADGIFTSGGTQTNLQALHLARGRVERRGLDRLRIFASADGHFSVQKAARLLGLGDDAVVCIPVDERHRMRPDLLRGALDRCLADGNVPMAVVATAGTTDFGAIDPLDRVADLCHTYATWFHVDAAYGGGLLASPRRRHLLSGIERADSVTVDYHKTWFQPVSASALIVRDTATLRHITWYADYLNPKDAAHPNQVDKSMQTTRRFDALKLWLTLRIMGPDLIGDYFDTVIDLAAEVHDAMVQCPDIELAAEPTLSTLVFRYRPRGADPATTDEVNTRIRAALFDSGRAMVASTKVDGEVWLKFTLLNPMATSRNILDIVDRVRVTGAEILTGAAR